LKFWFWDYSLGWRLKAATPSAEADTPLRQAQCIAQRGEFLRQLIFYGVIYE